MSSLQANATLHESNELIIVAPLLIELADLHAYQTTVTTSKQPTPKLAKQQTTLDNMFSIMRHAFCNKTSRHFTSRLLQQQLCTTFQNKRTTAKGSLHTEETQSGNSSNPDHSAKTAGTHLLKVISIDDDVETTELSQPELILLHTGIADFLPGARAVGLASSLHSRLELMQPYQTAGQAAIVGDVSKEDAGCLVEPLIKEAVSNRLYTAQLVLTICEESMHSVNICLYRSWCGKQIQVLCYVRFRTLRCKERNLGCY